MTEVKQFFWINPKTSYPTYKEMVIIRNSIDAKQNKNNFGDLI